MLDATQALTVLAAIDRDPAASPSRALLEHRLAAIAADLDRNSIFRPGELPDTHFMRFAIIDDPRGELGSLLAWETNHDGRAAAYLAQVARSAPAIDQIFACCADYPADGVRDVERWVDWMLARSVPAGAFYTGYRGVPRATVVNDRAVHQAIRDALDPELAPPRSSDRSPVPRCAPGAPPIDRTQLAALPRHAIQREICERVRAAHPELDLSPTGDEEARWLIGKLIAAPLAAVALALAIIAGPLWYLALRRRENRDIATAYVRPVDVDPAVRDAEDRVTQNQLTHVVDIKPGRFRLATLWLVLKAIDVAARVYSVRGDLGGITAIHFARWVILHDPRPDRPAAERRHRLLFFSNYDGSWESYLGEFIDRAAYGLTAVWSNTVGFPATQHLVLGGARDEEAFKQWTREHQIATQVWWSGAPDSTVQNIRDDIWIRRRLDCGLSDDELTTWLRKL